MFLALVFPSSSCLSFSPFLSVLSLSSCSSLRMVLRSQNMAVTACYAGPFFNMCM